MFSEQFAKELSSYEISIPARVTASGEFVSHSVHHTRQTLNHGASRFKRDTNNEPDTDNVHYYVHVDDMELHLSLEPNHKLLSSGFVVERRPEGFKNISYSKITAYPENQCHFTGHIQGHPGSKVALATCDGLVSDFYCYRFCKIMKYSIKIIISIKYVISFNSWCSLVCILWFEDAFLTENLWA